MFLSRNILGNFFFSNQIDKKISKHKFLNEISFRLGTPYLVPDDGTSQYRCADTDRTRHEIAHSKHCAGKVRTEVNVIDMKATVYADVEADGED